MPSNALNVDSIKLGVCWLTGSPAFSSQLSTSRSISRRRYGSLPRQYTLVLNPEGLLETLRTENSAANWVPARVNLHFSIPN